MQVRALARTFDLLLKLAEAAADRSERLWEAGESYVERPLGCLLGYRQAVEEEQVHREALGDYELAIIKSGSGSEDDFYVNNLPGPRLAFRHGRTRSCPARRRCRTM